MKCAKCQAELRPKARFCDECGHSVSSASAESGHEAGASFGALRTMAGPTRPADVSVGAQRTIVGGAGERSGAVNASGVILSDRYELLEKIGEGGFAEVYRARDRKLDRIVAIKRLLPAAISGSLGRQTLERFEREAVTIAQLSHRNIVQVFDHDVDAEGRYVVMEYVGGGSLRDLLKARSGKVTVEEAVELVRGIARGLAYAHRKNLVHRDIKPANILLAPADSDSISSAPSASLRDMTLASLPTPKIVDFGLARAGSESELSQSGYGMGTPWYMPPEQRRNAKGVNHTADIYALGKTIYELVSGETPDNVDPDKIPATWLARVILKCCKTNPEERFFSCDELLSALEEGRDGSRRRGERGAEKEGNTCSSCGTANLPDVKFCESCGAGLTSVCPECQRENSIHKQFCGGCGTEVDGFPKTQEALTRMERAATEKRWSRVVKEAQLLAERPVRLPGKQGKVLMATVMQKRQQAEQAQEKCARLRQVVDDKLAQGNFAEALEAAAQYREIDPHDAVLSRLTEQIDAAHQLLKRVEEALAAGDLDGFQSARKNLLAIPETQAGAHFIFARLDARMEQYCRAREAGCTAAAEKRFAVAIGALTAALAIAPKAVEIARERKECEATLERLSVSMQRATELLHKDNAAALAACKDVLSIEPGNAAAMQYTKDIEASLAQAALLRVQSEAALKERRPEEALVLWRRAQELDRTVDEKNAHVGIEQVVDLGDGVKLEFVWCSPGTFWMGSPSNEAERCDDEVRHQVTLSRGFWLGKFAVTQAQWAQVMGRNPAFFRNAGSDAPVELVNWIDCQAFIDKVNERVAGGRFRLPTEAEWEYACRAGTEGAFAGYLDGMCWHAVNSGGMTHPVGQKYANAWGLFDMHGNVWEWCADWYGAYASASVSDPAGPATGTQRVLRGASWFCDAWNCRSANRYSRAPAENDDNVGLRLARSP